jgi:hypothetical protein
MAWCSTPTPKCCDLVFCLTRPPGPRRRGHSRSAPVRPPGAWGSATEGAEAPGTIIQGRPGGRTAQIEVE